jgi:ribosomal protein L30/L7E
MKQRIVSIISKPKKARQTIRLLKIRNMLTST